MRFRRSISAWLAVTLTLLFCSMTLCSSLKSLTWKKHIENRFQTFELYMSSSSSLISLDLSSFPSTELTGFRMDIGHDGSATWSLPRNGGFEEFNGDSEFGPLWSFSVPSYLERGRIAPPPQYEIWPTPLMWKKPNPD